MKNGFPFILLLAALLVVPACNKKTVVPTAEVHFIKSADRTITLSSVGFGKRVVQAEANAERNAFEKLLFRGIPGSQFGNPMVGPPSVRDRHPDYFRRFFDEQGYRAFVTQTVRLTPGSRDRRTKRVRLAVEVTINYHSLRKDLEEHGIKHKFGF